MPILDFTSVVISNPLGTGDVTEIRVVNPANPLGVSVWSSVSITLTPIVGSSIYNVTGLDAMNLTGFSPSEYWSIVDKNTAYFDGTNAPDDEARFQYASNSLLVNTTYRVEIYTSVADTSMGITSASGLAHNVDSATTALKYMKARSSLLELYGRKNAAGTITESAKPTELLMSTNETRFKNNVEFILWKNGVVTDTTITFNEDGTIVLPDTDVEFDYVESSEPYVREKKIQADDAVDILRSIVELDILTAENWTAADINLNNEIQADDAVAVLRHIVELDDISNRFVIIDLATGTRVTTLPSTPTEVLTWSLVALGDVDQNGAWDSAYTKELVV